MYLSAHARIWMAFLIISPTGLRAQNLVKNPGFEEFVQCPDRLGNFGADVISWTAPTSASTDYFHACSEEMGTPDNFNGRQEPVAGKGYAGLYLYAPGDYREYVQGEFLQELEKGREYEIRFSISLAERSDYAVHELQALLVRNPISLDTQKVLSKSRLYRDADNTLTFVDLSGQTFYQDISGWVALSTRITAKGGERYIILGNFRENRATRVQKTGRNAKQGAYYYLDEVGVYALPGAPADSLEAALLPGTLGENFSGVLFGIDEHRLTEAARQTIRNLYSYLRDHPDLRVVVEGHTDNQGAAGYNLRLSERRCLAVTEYLQELGLSATRIDRIALGMDWPQGDNDTPIGRRQNRRVMFRLLTPEP